MRLLLVLAALAAAAPAAAAPPLAERTLMVRVTVPLAGAADRPAWRPRPPFSRGRSAASTFTGSDIAKNLSEGWWGIGILAVGGAVWLYQDQRD